MIESTIKRWAVPTLHRAQAVDKCQCFVTSLNAAFELCVADLFQELGELRAG